MKSTFDYSGKTVLVTGSSQNLGFTIARAFAQSHARVVLHGSSHEKLVRAKADLLSAIPGADVEAIPFNMRSQAEIEAAFADMEQRGLMPDVLVNNAAHLGLGVSEFLEQSPEFFRHVLEVNLFAVFRCSQLAAAAMSRKGGGSIVHISSLAGERVIHNRSAYNVSKAALDGLTRSMAADLAPLGIRVNAVVPGYVWTERWNNLSGENRDRRKKNTPAGAPTQQDEIAQTVMFLASSYAPTLIGSRVVIDGGLDIQQVPHDVAV